MRIFKYIFLLEISIEMPWIYFQKTGSNKAEEEKENYTSQQFKRGIFELWDMCMYSTYRKQLSLLECEKSKPYKLLGVCQLICRPIWRIKDGLWAGLRDNKQFVVGFRDICYLNLVDWKVSAIILKGVPQFPFKRGSPIIVLWRRYVNIANGRV